MDTNRTQIVFTENSPFFLVNGKNATDKAMQIIQA